MTTAALTILGPLAAAAVILAVRRGAVWWAVLGAGIGAAGAIITLAHTAGGETFVATLPGLPGYPLRLHADTQAVLFATTVAVVGLVVLVYAVGYMRGEEGQTRFYAGMSFFVAAMQAFVFAGDWLLLLAAWELIGVASYLLIGFWYDRPGVGSAATRAFLTTRVADFGLYLGVFILIAQTGTSEIAATLAVRGTSATVAALLLLLAAMGKAAQTPFSGWLLDAMAGPTPVSALLHAATLVAAGVILLIRVSPLLDDFALPVVGAVGGVTAVVAGVTALAQRDLKRLLAASTASQIGFMLLAVGAGAPVAAIAHLVAHAAMKGALFLGAGVFQHSRDATDFAALAGVGRVRRGVFLGFAVAGLALAGVPPLAGFWSKDAVIAAAFAAPSAPLLAPLVLAGTFLTGTYVARSLRLLWGSAGQNTAKDADASGGGWMGAGVAVLAALAATLGLTVPYAGPSLGTPLPENLAALAFGLAFAVVGLAAGWFVPPARLLGPVAAVAERGFRVAGGVVAFVVCPTELLAGAADRCDRAIHGGVLTIGHGVSVVAHGLAQWDGGVHRGVLAVGQASVALAKRSRRFDERGIDGAIAALVRGLRDLDLRARRLQSGFVSRELVLAAGGALLLLVLLVFLR